jgi:hypothetical protein
MLRLGSTLLIAEVHRAACQEFAWTEAATVKGKSVARAAAHGLAARIEFGAGKRARAIREQALEGEQVLVVAMLKAPGRLLQLTGREGEAAALHARASAISTSVVLVVANAGYGPVTVAAIHLAGRAHAFDEQVTQDACTGQTLAVGESCPVTVGVASRAVGAWSGTLSIRIRDGDTIEVALTGAGVER